MDVPSITMEIHIVKLETITMDMEIIMDQLAKLQFTNIGRIMVYYNFNISEN